MKVMCIEISDQFFNVSVENIDHGHFYEGHVFKIHVIVIMAK